jgi:D-3-phosphoglycerate dehydrogenase
LSLKLGKFGGQIIENTISKINITFKGKISSLNTKPLIANVVAGIFSNRMESVNLINAETIAKQKNIEIISSYQTETSIHTSEIHITISTSDEEFNYAGITFANNSRIISIKNMRIEGEISPNMLYILNNDKPGFIGSLGTLLGSKNINIANFNLGRTGRGEAVSLLELDQYLNNALINDLQKLTNIKKVKALKF